MTLSLDIVIPTYRREHLLAPLIAALLRQRSASDGILVVRQGNAPLPQQPLSREIRVLSLDKPNLPAARNTALNASNADIVLFLDDDIEPQPGLVDAHRSCYADSAISGVAGFVDDPLFDRAQPRPSFIDLSTGECVQNFSCPHSGPTISAMGANMSFRREALLAIGGFDTCYKANALWEDVDACLRMLATGRSLRFCADAKVRHLRQNAGGCRSDSGRRYLFHQFANTAYFGCRFAQPRHYRSWLRFWKYRLEFLSRVADKRQGAVRHDLVAVMAGIAGAVAGILRHARRRLSPDAAMFRIDRAALRKAFLGAGIS